MISEKLKRILKSKTDLTEEQINLIPESDGWALIYSIENADRNDKKSKRLPEVCFTGFSKSDRERLSIFASDLHFQVKESVTANLEILVIGDNAGESKIAKARSQGCKMVNELEFREFVKTI